ncbi:methylmalonyl Co-A mutase-associated GTPase MeaB [Cesiribacter andamanensis]|uniref:Putative GTPase n=1 Tax=Cesiribacter andamanensis AMV16 TaxID=1279009 RepID=M7NRW0_9BACT|nr:methylmalonyl Co-A mutase-associated GTPase MeaB [Cesiribacter andamanensis]EMR01219.1 putative GTPase [Cesiribacter andamanensis AMV16]
MSPIRRPRLSAAAYAEGVLAGDRLLLSRAITLAESSLPDDQALARQVMDQILPHTGRSIRLGITGVPGVGKSTFIERFGTYITGLGKKVAVLAIDPSSQRSGGSILGDKTRMEQLSHNPLAYIRPSAAGSALGGVAARTREALLLCEAAGFEVILIETVGVGQSETAVRNMVDFFLLLMLAGAGDELQGIKKGIMEMADGLAITKADGANKGAARQAQAAYKNALHLFPPTASGWIPPVLTCSAQEGNGLEAIWEMIEKYERHSRQKGYFEHQRRQQNLAWMHSALKDQLKQYFYSHPAVAGQRQRLEEEVKEGQTGALGAAHQLFSLFRESMRD